MIFTKAWWVAAGTRAARTFFQAVAGVLPAAITISDVDWLVVLGTALLASVMSFLTSLAGLPELDDKESPLWKAALIRALKTMAQTAAAMIPAAVTIFAVDWVAVAGAAALAGIVSLAMSFAAGLPEDEDRT